MKDEQAVEKMGIEALKQLQMSRGLSKTGRR